MKELSGLEIGHSQLTTAVSTLKTKHLSLTNVITTHFIDVVLLTTLLE